MDATRRAGKKTFDLEYVNSMGARSRPAGSGSVRHAALFVCGSLCSFVPWTGAESIADIN